jgi:hypothetical protein
MAAPMPRHTASGRAAAIVDEAALGGAVGMSGFSGFSQVVCVNVNLTQRKRPGSGHVESQSKQTALTKLVYFG